ncbi:MAG: hypothetical protein ACTSUD_05705 [Alphaproteobacteria bacterium]
MGGHSFFSSSGSYSSFIVDRLAKSVPANRKREGFEITRIFMVNQHVNHGHGISCRAGAAGRAQSPGSGAVGRFGPLMTTKRPVL